METKAIKEKILEELNLLLCNKDYEQIIKTENPVQYLFLSVNQRVKTNNSEFIKFKDYFYALTELFIELEKSDPIFFLLNSILKTADPRDLLNYRKMDADYKSLNIVIMN